MLSYQSFLLDYIFENSDFFEAKDGVYKENYFLKENLQKANIAEPLSKLAVREQLVEFTGKYIDDHSKELSTSGPVYIVTFGERETSVLYEMFNMDSETLIDLYLKMVDETYYGKISKFFTGWIKNAPHKLLLTAILCEAYEKSYDDIIECCEYLWAFAVYPTVYRTSFPITVKEDVMNYTIEHLGAKFKVKQVKNLLELLKYDSTTAVEFFAEPLKSGVDNVYIDLMYRMENQIKSKIQNIAHVYYENIKNNATLHDNISQFDDGSLADQDGRATTISRIVEKTINKFGSGEMNPALIKLAANGTQTDAGNLSGFISQIKSTKANRIPKFVEDIITAYFNKYPGNVEILAGEFTNFYLALYRSIGTSKDPVYAEIKSILSFWMNDIIEIRKLYPREATIINYTKAVFNYFSSMINYYNN